MEESILKFSGLLSQLESEKELKVKTSSTIKAASLSTGIREGIERSTTRLPHLPA